MKIKILYIGLSVFLLSWIIPSLVELSLDSSSRYPFTYYSSVVNQFCYFDQEDDNVRGRDMSGRTYTDAEFDRVLPMFYYRQLAPVIALYPMFESCSGKVDLENPSDMFRLKENIEFIDMATNRVDEQKSARFQQALEKAGFAFPAQWVAGIPTSQKSYDEGYFALDSEGHLFHVKMTNGKPFVKDTKVRDISCMLPMEIENRSLYGFLFDTHHTLYYLSTDGYRLVKVLDDVDPDKDRVSIMANMFYWTVAKTTSDGEHTYALESRSMQRVDSLFRPAPESTWDKTLPYLFPFTVTFQDSTNSYIYPRVSGYYFPSLPLNIVLAVVTLIVYRKDRSRGKYLAGIITLCTGIAGFITVCLFARIRK